MFSDRTAKIMLLVKDLVTEDDQHATRNSPNRTKCEDTHGADKVVTNVSFENIALGSGSECNNFNSEPKENRARAHLSSEDELLSNEDDDDSVADPAFEPENLSFESDKTKEDKSASEDEQIPLHQKQGRPKKGRKLKHGTQTRAGRKINRNSNKPYYNCKGEKIEPKIFVDFDCNCTMKCKISIPAEIRRQEFERLWSLKSYNSQVGFIAALVTEREKKRVYGTNPDKRKYSRVYKIANKVVCREMFVKTLGISTYRVNTALRKMHGRAPLTDQRGVKQGGHNKLSDVKVQEVVDQIKRIPIYISHYCRTQTEAQFLPPEVTLSKMYEKYRDEYENPVSFDSYKKIFYEHFNLKTKTLKKDTCNICDRLTIETENESDPVKKEDLIKKHNIHIEEAANAQAQRRKDFKIAKENREYECLTFDLQKTLPLPRIPTNIVFYKRQLWVYNAGVHSGKEDRGYCYVWAEGVAGRGAQEVGSCLRKHLKLNLPTEVRHLILWSDSCGGQNRNIKLTLILKSILHNTPQLSDITLKFLYTGHSFLPNDSDFSDIESALKHQQRLYLPSDYIDVMRNCKKKKPLVVTEMTSDDYVGVVNIEKNIVNRKINQDGEKISWLRIRTIQMDKSEPYLLKIQENSFSEPFQFIDIKKSTRGRPSLDPGAIYSDLIKLWPNGKPIADAKLLNLKEMMHLIPNDCVAFYENLKGTSNIQEDVDGFNLTELDFEAEPHK